MFARTRRLLLRPAWPEDAGELARAIAHEGVASRLARVPWPYTAADAEAFVAQPRGAHEPRFLVCDHHGGVPRIVGGIGLSQVEGEYNLGYWLTPIAWGRGYATEAGRAVVAMARDALPVGRLIAHHHRDNRASGAVLRKLGFRETGHSLRFSLAQGGEVASVDYMLDLAPARVGTLPIAA